MEAQTPSIESNESEGGGVGCLISLLFCIAVHFPDPSEFLTFPWSIPVACPRIQRHVNRRSWTSSPQSRPCPSLDGERPLCACTPSTPSITYTTLKWWRSEEGEQEALHAASSLGSLPPPESSKEHKDTNDDNEGKKKDKEEWLERAKEREKGRMGLVSPRRHSTGANRSAVVKSDNESEDKNVMSKKESTGGASSPRKRDSGDLAVKKIRSGAKHHVNAMCEILLLIPTRVILVHY